MESRADEDDPIPTISHTSEDDSRRAGDHCDELDPTRMESLMDCEESICETPTTSSEDSIRKKSAITTKTLNVRNPILPEKIQDESSRKPTTNSLDEEVTHRQG